MDLPSTLILAAGLAMDALAVSISSGVSLKEIRIPQALKIASFFGLFQALMPLCGWLAGLGFRQLIQHIDHWIAFGLLLLIGAHMIRESFGDDCDTQTKNPLNTAVLLGLSVATSIDALAAGISFALLRLNILVIVSLIGAVTFILSFFGARLGRRLGCRFGARVERLGGAILILIGVKILVQHLTGDI